MSLFASRQRHPSAKAATPPGVSADEAARPRKPSAIQHLQQAAGNQAMQRLLHTPSSGAQGGSRLPVHPPGDRYEQEAERAARQVAGGATRPALQRARAGGADAAQAVPDTQGQPLDSATRRWMEGRFGHAFGHVQVHADDRAATAAGALQARAYTTGQHIVFARGQFRPHTGEGRQLLAHELAHVVQQGGQAGMVQRQPAGTAGSTTAAPATAQDQRDFVRDTIDFFNMSVRFFSEPRVTITAALFETLINNWYLMVVDRERIIRDVLSGDVMLTRELQAAYTAAIRLLISRAATTFKRSEADLYRENSGRIPMWAWQTAHRLVPGFSTPIAEGRSPDLLTGEVAFGANGFSITIAPDGRDASLGNGAETRININPGAATIPYNWSEQGGVRTITSFTAPGTPTARIQTFYGPGVTATSSSGYGRGTTAQDIAGGRVTPHSTSLGFHEGNHGLDFVAFLEANPPPAFTGAVGMTETAFLAAITTWRTAWTTYNNRLKAFSDSRTDCVGTTIDQFHQANAAPGATITAVCVP